MSTHLQQSRHVLSVVLILMFGQSDNCFTILIIRSICNFLVLL